MNRRVLAELLRIWRPIASWFWSVAIVGLIIAIAIVNHVTTPDFSLWSTVAGWAARNWLAVVGSLLVALHLRQFVAAGATRRSFLYASAQLGLILAAGFALIVTIGHSIERATVGTAAYPQLMPLREFVTLFLGGLAYFVSGYVITAGFYRLGPFGGLALIPLGALPSVAVEGLLGRGSYGEIITRLLPWGAGVVVTIALVGLAVVLGHRELRDAPIRRATTA
jgi:hypothetical protein